MHVFCPSVTLIRCVETAERLEFVFLGTEATIDQYYIKLQWAWIRQNKSR